jgi:hypothetical protein
MAALDLENLLPESSAEAITGVASGRQHLERFLPRLQTLITEALSAIVASPEVDDPIRELGRQLLTRAPVARESTETRSDREIAIFWDAWCEDITKSVRSALAATCAALADDPRRDLGYRLFVGVGRDVPAPWVTEVRLTKASLPTGVRLLETLRRDSMWSAPVPQGANHRMQLPSGSRGVSAMFVQHARRFFEVHDMLGLTLEDAGRGEGMFTVVGLARSELKLRSPDLRVSCFNCD